jgi:methyl-accepting chemotaxis protein
MVFFRSDRNAEALARLAALDRVQAIIEFDPDGTILSANQNFLDALGYSLSEIKGRHHSMFVSSRERDSQDYRQFWERLKGGQSQSGQFMRIAKGGREVWIEASYNPVPGRGGKPARVIKFAIDVTRRVAADADRAGEIAAIRRSQAVIEFALDGKILNANDNFLDAMGYTIDEIRGEHHAIFVDATTRASADYAAFWQRLRNGEYQAAQYKRLGKGGREVWIQASYNPILDAAGRPTRIVKFATDITAQIELLSKLRVMIDHNFAEIDSAVSRSTAQSGAASDAAASTATSVQVMAAAAEELASSVAEISESMAKSRTATDSAFDQAKAAGDFTRRLSDAAAAMGGIVGLIQTIAGQINLLALNATIESARAGEAGRGFAVVAQEVKNLASQAAKATEQIASEIAGIQSISAEVVGALESIRSSVDVMRENVVATASSLEEQSAVTRDMSSNMHGAAKAVEAISENVAAISSAVTEVSSAVATTREAARVLAR